METLQHELKIFRFPNQFPNEHLPEKYIYKFYKNSWNVENVYSDNEFLYGKVSIINNRPKMDLLRHPKIDSREMEDRETFLVTVIISN
jgi:hypothetical protein